MSELKRPLHKGQDVHSGTRKSVIIGTPYIIGYMSVDVTRQYHSDLSQLKFLNSIFNEETSLDLNHNISAAVKRTTDDNGEKIDLLLRFLKDRHKYLYPEYEKVDFITYRRTLISIMCANFSYSRPLYVTACIYKGSIFLHLIQTEQEKSRRAYHSKDEEKYCAWGYKFEQYLLSDQPNLKPDIQRPVIENEEFSLYYNTTLGHFKLLYGAQTDGLLTKTSTSGKPISTDFVNNLNYLRENEFVELKTNREIHNFKQEKNFKRFKLLRCWCQCYLADLKGLYVGFRNDQGIVKRLQWFKTDDIVSYCKIEWNPTTAMNFLDYFLGFVKHNFKPYQNHSSPVALQFAYTNSSEMIEVKKCDNDILPTWFTKIN